ncbi:MAG: PIN domain-containing protein [Candidatus Asgardarchaeia archaeon]
MASSENKTQRLIILDANFLLVPIKNRIDILSELYSLLTSPFKVVVLSGTIDELKRKYKSLKVGKERKELQFAIKYASQFEIIPCPLEENKDMDDVIIDFAVKHKAIVATNDTKLRKKLRKFKVPTIFVREKKYLKINGYE